MSQFHGPQPGYKTERPYGNNGPKGTMRARKAQKKLEAEVRDELLPADDPKRRVIRLGTGELNLDKPRRRRRTRRKEVIQSVEPTELREIMETVLEEDAELLDYLAEK